ncbi:hypothetical protein BTVI_21858 [Pitangus sulphuratus]|nr:hypothetical protein BTVI_21858 [Pitangus sulphuratus]
MGNKQEELEAIVQQESYDVVAITETWWDDSHDWGAAMDGYKLFRRDRQGQRVSDNVVAFHDGEMTMVNKRRMTGVIYIDFCKALDTDQHDILISTLERQGWLDFSVDKELSEWTQPESFDQWLNVHVESSHRWCPPPLEKSALRYLHQ